MFDARIIHKGIEMDSGENYLPLTVSCPGFDSLGLDFFDVDLVF